jgi:sporulation protein YlmC with PRC-barrel domain
MSTHYFRLWTAMTAVAGLVLAVGLVAVSRGQAPMHNPNAMPGGEHGWKASELIGLAVYNNGDEEKGKIKDLMLGPNGQVEYAAVSFGGFLGMGNKLFAVPWDAIHLEWKDNKIHHAKVDVSEDSIKQRQGFDENHWPERADRGFNTVR